VVAPFEMHERVLTLTDREIEHARQGLPARVIARMNSLVDPGIIEAFYRASQAGVKIDLVIRGICCLRPGVKGVSENITVRSVVDRFLEHSRVWYFENACRPEVFIGSADWMPRNLFRRIETAFPIEDGNLRERVISEILAVTLRDNVKARTLQSDGTYTRAAPAKGTPVHRSQFEFISLALNGRTDRRLKTDAGSKYPKVRLAPRPKALGPKAPR
jgi:polyphosphate kinase